MPEWASKDATETSCGSAGCACGWAATVFNREGWSLSKLGIPLAPSEYESEEVELTVKNRGKFHHIPGPAVSFAVFFGISIEDSIDITCNLDSLASAFPFGGLVDKPCYLKEYGVSPRNITPMMAADRIRKILRTIDPEALEEVSKPQYELIEA